MGTQNEMAVLIHQQLGQTLREVFANPKGIFADRANPFDVSGGTLLEQLQAPNDDPPKITLRVILNLVPEGPARASSLARLRERLAGAPDRLREHLGRLEALASAIDSDAAQRAGAALLGELEDRWSNIKAFIRDDLGTILPLATVANAALNLPIVPQEVERALLTYFFRAEGYTTVDGSIVVAPVHLEEIVMAGAEAVSAVTASQPPLQPIKRLFPRATAEHYIRDITRIIVESAYDAARDLRERYAEIARALPERPGPRGPAAIERKFLIWFRGCSSLAESAVMRAVETGTQGVSQFQTNPLIAAAAGSFAGTVARKLAQESFLASLGKELGR